MNDRDSQERSPLTSEPSSEEAQGHVSENETSSQQDQTLRQSPEERERAAHLSKDRLSLPAKVPGYIMVRSLGEGSYGAVWLAQEENTGKYVAIKFYTYRRGLDWSLLNRRWKNWQSFTLREISSVCRESAGTVILPIT